MTDPNSSRDMNPAAINPTQPGTGTSVLSAEHLRNILWAFALCFFAGTIVDYVNSGDNLPVRVSIGRVAVSLLIAVSGLLAHWKRPTWAYALFSLVYLLGLFNGAFIAGFGINSPAFVIGLVPVLLATGLFDRNRAMLACIPIFAGWLIVMFVQFYDPSLFKVLNAPNAGSREPSSSAWAISCLLTIIPAIVITLAGRRQLEKSIEIERELRTEALTLLEKQTKWARERDEFMGHVSHELRTPLAAMRNALTLARHPKASEAVREKSLRTLDTSIGNMTGLLDDVLDAFKYGSAGFNLRKIDFSAVELLSEIDALYADLAEQRGLKLLIDTHGASNERLTGDPTRIKQMLSNLVSNAIKFTRAGHVTVRIERIDATASIWRFEVRDTGPGIAEHEQSLLFKPFSQLTHQQSGNAPVINGTGLGLSIVSQLAHAMGGRAGLTSQPGQGSVFYFDIPLPVASKSVTSAALAHA